MKHHTKFALSLIAATAIVGAASVPVLAHGSNWNDGAMGADQGYGMMQGEDEGPGRMGKHDGPGRMDKHEGPGEMGEHDGPGGMGRHDGPGGMGEPGMVRTMMRMMMSMQGGMMGGGMGGNGPMGALLGNFDANGDGTVTPQEVRDGMTALLKKYDTDGSGTLSLDEFEALYSATIRERMVDRFQALDNDGDGQVTGAEITAPADRLERMQTMSAGQVRGQGSMKDGTQQGPMMENN